MKSKIKNKIIVKSKRPYNKYKSFKRESKTYGNFVRTNKPRPATSTSPTKERIIKGNFELFEKF